MFNHSSVELLVCLFVRMVTILQNGCSLCWMVGWTCILRLHILVQPGMEWTMAVIVQCAPVQSEWTTSPVNWLIDSSVMDDHGHRVHVTRS